MFRLAIVVALVGVTVYAVWYLLSALVYAWLLVCSADGGAPPYARLSRLAPRMAAETERTWADWRTRGEPSVVERSFRRTWPLGMLFMLTLLALPVLVLVLLWMFVLQWL